LEELWNVNLREEEVLDDQNYDGWYGTRFKEVGIKS
jgi:hypothetical protein